MSDPTKTHQQNVLATVALVFEITPNADGTVPTETRLLPAGYFRATDGRPRECAAWFLDATVADQVIRRAQEHKNDILIDYEHQSLYTEKNGQVALAAGWAPPTNLQWRDSGLWATNIDWTDKAHAHIAAKELRYTSAVFTYYENTGEVIEIISATLTNSPALDDLDDLAALKCLVKLNRNLTQGNNMEKDQQIVALTVERDTIKQSLAALTTERDGLNTKVAALTTERDTLATELAALKDEKAQAALVQEKADCDGLIQAALKDGKVLPVVVPFLEKLNKADLTEYLTKTAGVELAILGKQHKPGNQGAGVDLQNGEAIAHAATRYQSEQKALGIDVDDISAIQHVTSQTGR
ncbi:phage protease [Methylosoma difficile]